MSLSPVPPRSGDISESSKGSFTIIWYGWFRTIWSTLNPGISTTVTLAKLTAGGTNGTLTIVNGIVTTYTPPT